MSADFIPREDETVDEILDGRLRIVQRKRGYRFSIDALLLAHFAVLHDKDDLIDLGTGSGIIALILMHRFNCGRVVGVDIQEALISTAKKNVLLNGIGQRAEMCWGDVRRPQSFCEPESFSSVVFNPPYRRVGSGRINPDPEKAAARHEINGTVDDFLAAAAYALRPGGAVHMIYPSVRIAELIVKMKARRIEPKRFQMVHSHRGCSGVFVLMEGLKGGRENVKVLSPLFIYRKTGGYTREMQGIFKDLSNFRVCGGV